MPRTYALMAPDGVLEIAFQAEGISDAWIFAQDHMQRPAEELGNEGFTITPVTIWPEGVRPSAGSSDFWKTMESAPRDRDILLYIGERPADTPWVQGRYIGNAGNTNGYWSSTLGMVVHPVRWAEPPTPTAATVNAWHTPAGLREAGHIEVEPTVRVFRREGSAVQYEGVCQLRRRNGRGSGYVTVTRNDWEHAPEETRNAITNVSRMAENEDRREMEYDLADTVYNTRQQRIRAQHSGHDYSTGQTYLRTGGTYLTIETSEWAILPVLTRVSILDALRMDEGEERIGVEAGLAEIVTNLRVERLRAADPTHVNIPAEQADAFLQGEPITVDVDDTYEPVRPGWLAEELRRTQDVPVVNTPIVREGVEQAIRGFLQRMQTRGPIPGDFQLPDMGEQYARVDNEGVVDALFDSIPGALEEAIQRVQDMDLSDQTVVYAIHRIGNERDTTYCRRIIRELRARYNRQQQGDQWVHGGVNQPTLEGRLVYVRDTDLSNVNVLYNIPREEGESDETYRDRLARELIDQAPTGNAAENPGAEEQEEVAPGVVLVEHDISHRLAVQQGERDYASITTGMASGHVLDDIARVYGLTRDSAGGYNESDEALRLRLQRAIRNQRPTAPNTEHAIREMSPGVTKGVEAELKTGEMESGVLYINGQRVFRVEVVIHENMHNGVHVSTTSNTQDAVWLSKADIEITHCRGIMYITLDYQYAVANGFINEYQERSR